MDVETGVGVLEIGVYQVLEIPTAGDAGKYD